MSSKSEKTVLVNVGGLIAAYCSWTTWHSLGWAILHSLCGWLYVAYWLIEYFR